MPAARSALLTTLENDLATARSLLRYSLDRADGQITAALATLTVMRDGDQADLTQRGERAYDSEYAAAAASVGQLTGTCDAVQALLDRVRSLSRSL